MHISRIQLQSFSILNEQGDTMTNEADSFELNTVLKLTRDELEKGLSDEDKKNLDLSYITQEYLDYLEKNSEEKDLTKCCEDHKGLPQDENAPDELISACYIGNRLVKISTSRYSYVNCNFDPGCDKWGHMCCNGRAWRAYMKRVNTTSWSCQPPNIGAFAGWR